MNDKEIVQLFFDRDERAVSEASTKYDRYCRTVAGNILVSKEDIDECVNDAFLNAWNSIPPNKPENLATYLGKLARNLSFNRYNAEHTQKRGSGEIPLILDELEELVSGKENLEGEIIQNELIEEINTFLKKLPSDKRFIFVRRYWYSDSIEMIAKKLGRSVNSISVSLNRIRKDLKGYLAEREYEL